MARIIDGLIFGVVYWILSFITLQIFGVILSGLLAALIGFGAYAAYDYVMHSKDGQTIGKKIMKIRLVGQNGKPLDSSALLKRAAIYPGIMALYGIPVVGFLTGLAALAIGIFVLVDKPLHQGLHDKAVGSVVVKAG